MLFSLKFILGSIMTAGILGLIVVGAFVMNPFLFIDSEDMIVNHSMFLSAPRDNVHIEELSIVGMKLVINATYGGGCKDHIFKLIASDQWLESYPVQTPVLFSHDANEDMCTALFMDIFVFNLTPLKERYQEIYRESSGTIYLRIEAGTETIGINFSY
jgi:hypothetical protein